MNKNGSVIPAKAGIQYIFFCLFCLFHLLPFSSFASQENTIGTESEVEQSEEAPQKPESLHEAVDRRFRYSKKHQNEFGIYVGDYLGDEWKNTWDFGARYMFHFNNTFGLGVTYLYSPINASKATSFGASLNTERMHLGNVEAYLSNDCAFRAGHSIIECELFFTLGCGGININEEWEVAGILGGGMKIYTGVPWLAIRLDVNAVLHPTPIPTGDTFNVDMVTNGGVSFLFPIRKPPKRN